MNIFKIKITEVIEVNLSQGKVNYLGLVGSLSEKMTENMGTNPGEIIFCLIKWGSTVFHVKQHLTPIFFFFLLK